MEIQGRRDYLPKVGPPNAFALSRGALGRAQRGPSAPSRCSALLGDIGHDPIGVQFISPMC